jgi:uncharacterized protein YaaR (DUF327 family)
MSKIDSVGDSFTNKSLQKKKRQKKIQAGGLFSSILHTAAETEETAEFGIDPEAANETLHEILDDVSALGEALVQTPTLENVRRYRDGIRQFMKYLVRNVLEVEERTSGANVLKRKKYLLVKTVDEKLEALAKGFLSAQKAPLDLAGRINEINGLLIDLLR